MDNYSHDNSGNRCGEGVVAVDPVPASGAALAGLAAGTDQTVTVVGGTTYAITFSMDSGTWLLSATGVTSTDENVEWIGIEGTTITVTIPHGSTTLYFECDTATQIARMRTVA